LAAKVQKTPLTGFAPVSIKVFWNLLRRSLRGAPFVFPAVGTIASRRAESTLPIVFQKISIIDSNPILYKQCTILIGKRDPLVMLFLLHDISDYRVLFTGSFAKTGIFSRPTSKIRE